MSFVGRAPSRESIRRLMAAGQDAFRRALAARSLDAARRIQRAYKAVQDQLDQELRAAAALNYDDTALRRLRGRVADSLAGMTQAIQDQAQLMERVGAEAGSAAALRQGAGIGARWNAPPPEQMEGLIGYVDSPAFRQVVESFGDTHAEGVIDRILTLVSQGRDPDTVTRGARVYLNKMPFYDAVRLVRTTQLWSARQGMRAVYQANQDVVKGWVWSSARDTRTCGSCWAMHGTVHGVDEVLNDHHLGRCAPIPLTERWADLGFSDGIELGFERGEDAFGALPARDQQTILGMARWRAWQDGLFSFDALSQPYQNPLFGEMRREASLDQLIGHDAARLYQTPHGAGNAGE